MRFAHFLFSALPALYSVGCSLSHDQEAYIDYIKQFNKHVKPEEMFSRYHTFIENRATVDAVNRQQSSYMLGVNSLLDVPRSEYRHRLNFKSTSVNGNLNVNVNNTTAKEATELPTNFDWRASHVVAPVSDWSGNCGSANSLVSLEVLESAYAISVGSFSSLSYQELIDCSGGACGNPQPPSLFDFAVTNGLCSASDYKSGGTDDACNVDGCKPTARYKSVTTLQQPDAEQMRQALAVQPLMVAVEADNLAFQLYQGGILDSSACGTAVDHLVLLVGWGSDVSSGSAVDYWTIQNEWGASWGEAGTMRIARGKNVCGIETLAYGVTVDTN